MVVLLVLCCGGVVWTTEATDNHASVRDFGARGNGEADDTNAIQSAVAATIGKGRILNFPPGLYRITNGIKISGNGLTMRGSGATIWKDTSGTANNVLTIIDATNVTIDGLGFQGSYDGYTRGSTGSNPLILLSSNAQSLNDTIVIARSRFKYGNHAAITIDGRWSRKIAHRNIIIEDNSMEYAGAGVFGYKNIDGMRIVRNSIRKAGSVGIMLDTRAETDSDTSVNPVRNVLIEGNVVVDSGGSPGFQGRGITLKGHLFDITVARNVIRSVTSAASAPTFGIVVIRDAGGSVGANVTIRDNVLSGIHEPGTTGWAVWVGSGFTGVAIENNVISDAARGIRVDSATNVTVIGNSLLSLATVAESPIHVASTTGGRAKQVKIDRNMIVQGHGKSHQAISLQHADGVSLGGNVTMGFRQRTYIDRASVSGLRSQE
jgi:polygalacturonase